MTTQSRAGVALGCLLALQFAWGAQYVFRTSFVHTENRVFSLWDDAMISMQYARNLSEGNGLVWNAGDEPVQGFTNLGVTLVMAAIHGLPISQSKVALAVQLVTLCLLSGSTLLLWRIARSLYPDHPPIAWGTALAVVLCAPVGIWSLQGSDVAFVTFWLSASVAAIVASWRPSRLLIVLGSGLWIRPDAALYYVVLVAAAAWVRRDHRLLGGGCGLLIATLGVQMGFSHLYYGDVLPNTYYLKATGSPRTLMLASGLGEFLSWLPHLMLALALAVYALLCERRRTEQQGTIWALAILFGVAQMYNIWVGGDFIFGYGSRFVVPTLPFLLLLAIAGGWQLTARLWPRESVGRSVTFAIVASAISIIANPVLGTAEWLDPFAPPMHRDNNRNNYNFARYLRLYTDPSVTLAAHWGGVPVYFSGRRAFDVLGKSDRHIARIEVDHFFPGHSKWDWNYVLRELKPDVFRAPSRGLGEREDFRSDYLKVETSHDVSFYLRRSRAANLYDPDAVLIDLNSGQRMRLPRSRSAPTPAAPPD